MVNCGFLNGTLYYYTLMRLNKMEPHWNAAPKICRPGRRPTSPLLEPALVMWPLLPVYVCKSTLLHHFTSSNHNLRNFHILDLPDCTHCGQFSSSSIQELIDHCKNCSSMLRPNPYKHKFVCYTCDYHTYSLARLKTHIHVHLGQKPFTCNLCPYSAREKTVLNAHMRKYHAYGVE